MTKVEKLFPLIPTFSLREKELFVSSFLSIIISRLEAAPTYFKNCLLPDFSLSFEIVDVR